MRKIMISHHPNYNCQHGIGLTRLILPGSISMCEQKLRSLNYLLTHLELGSVNYSLQPDLANYLFFVRPMS